MSHLQVANLIPRWSVAEPRVARDDGTGLWTERKSTPRRPLYSTAVTRRRRGGSRAGFPARESLRWRQMSCIWDWVVKFLCYVKLNLFQYSVWPFFFSSWFMVSMVYRYQLTILVAQTTILCWSYGLCIVWPVRCRRIGRVTACDLFAYKYTIRVIYFYTQIIISCMCHTTILKDPFYMFDHHILCA